MSIFNKINIGKAKNVNASLKHEFFNSSGSNSIFDTNEDVIETQESSDSSFSHNKNNLAHRLDISDATLNSSVHSHNDDDLLFDEDQDLFVAGKKSESEEAINQFAKDIGKKPTPLPFIGSFKPKSQYVIAFSMMVASLVGAGGLAATGFLRVTDFQERSASGTQLKMLSQRLLASTQYSLAGSSDAFSKLRQSREDVVNEFSRLSNGTSTMRRMNLDENEDLKRANMVFSKEIIPIVDSLLSIGSTIADLPGFSSRLSQNSTLISADLERLLTYLISINAPQTQITAASQLLESAEQVRRSGQSLLSGNDSDNQIGDKYLEKRIQEVFSIFKSTFSGNFSLSEDGLTLNGKKVTGDYAQVDSFRDKFNGTAAVFQWNGDDFFRVTTSVRNDDGSRVLGSLGKTHPAYSQLAAGESYTGRVILFDRPYITKYEAIKDANGKLIGVLYVGFEIVANRSSAEILQEYNQAYSTFKSTLNALVSGDSDFGMKELRTDTGVAMLEDLKPSADDLVLVNNFIQGNVKQLLDARKSLQSMLISTESALLSTSRFVDAMSKHSTASFVLVYYSSALVALALLALALIGLINNRVSRINSWSAAFKNKSNERDIINFMGEIVPLEMGDLTSSFTNDIASMEGLTGGIRSSVNEAVTAIREAMRTVKSTTGSVMANVSESVESSIDLQNSNDRQSKEIDGAVESVANLAAAIQDVRENTVRAAEMTLSAKSASDEGARVVSKTNEKMSEIRSSMQDVLKSVKHLGETSHEIGSIVEAIETITDRTQVIAVNASLEAAKAGSAGQGFQVLAKEVNRLAEQSNEALRSITALVLRIQGETAATIRVVEESTNNVVEGAKLSANANTELSKISFLSEQLQDVMAKIRYQSENQFSSAGQVRESMDRLNALSVQFQSTMSNMVLGVKQIDASMGSLQSTVSVFTTESQLPSP